jgi:hypothetical protein
MRPMSIATLSALLAGLSHYPNNVSINRDEVSDFLLVKMRPSPCKNFMIDEQPNSLDLTFRTARAGKSRSKETANYSRADHVPRQSLSQKFTNPEATIAIGWVAEFNWQSCIER